MKTFLDPRKVGTHGPLGERALPGRDRAERGELSILNFELT
jgi:hypothetical protein